VFVDHEIRINTHPPGKEEIGLMTEFQLPDRVLDLKWEFSYGIDKSI